ncbi:M12 family metallopeptidase, partial [Aquimarina sp. RZ0]|uniref:M12 family metallopeptidase n=1 Tax=Aquimarina sp. RZ0 TaxID=2607730 RepID=UPI0012538AB3
MKNYFKIGLTSLIMTAVCLIFVGCETETFQDEPSQGEGFATEEAYPGREGTLHSLKLNDETVIAENFGEKNVSVIGDMLFYTDESDGAVRSAGRTGGRWPNNTVYYEIQNGMPNQRRITDAIRHWESKTALRFVKRTNQGAYIFFQKGSGCSSFV